MPTSSPSWTLKLTPWSESVRKSSTSRHTGLSFSHSSCRAREKLNTDSFSIINLTSSLSLMSFMSPAPTVLPLRRRCIYLRCGRFPPCGARRKQLPCLTFFQSPINSKRRCTWRLSRLAVASSRMTIHGSKLIALRISISCFSSGGREANRIIRAKYLFCMSLETGIIIAQSCP